MFLSGNIYFLLEVLPLPCILVHSEIHQYIKHRIQKYLHL